MHIEVKIQSHGIDWGGCTFQLGDPTCHLSSPCAIGGQEEAANVEVINAGTVARLVGKWRSAAAVSVHQWPGTAGCIGTRASCMVRLRARGDLAEGVGARSTARPRGSGDAEAAWGEAESTGGRAGRGGGDGVGEGARRHGSWEGGGKRCGGVD
jgi:hypothetical protein